jgi:hypothetical protein
LHLAQVFQLRSFADMALLTKTFVLISVAFWATRVIVVVVHGFQFWEIKAFFNAALKISDTELDSVSWWDVQQRLLAAQAGLGKTRVFKKNSAQWFFLVFWFF